MSYQPFISIITSVKNGAPHIRGLIESVLSQDYTAFEHIIVDDGSDDSGATVQILREYPHLRWWSRENKGQYASQNEALWAAIGDIIVVISADDAMVTPNTLSRVATAWQHDPALDVIFGKALHMDSNGELLPYQLDVTGEFASRVCRHHLFIQHCSLFVSRATVVRNAVWFDPTFKYAGDWDWIVRILLASKSVKYIPEPLSIIRKHAAQTSRVASGSLILEEHRRVCSRYGGSYSVHIAIKETLQYWAMFRIAAHIAIKDGPETLWNKFVDWRHRRSLRNQ
jgi:glycosyltransferase involved in cell wall biosynthesis